MAPLHLADVVGVLVYFDDVDVNSDPPSHQDQSTAAVAHLKVNHTHTGVEVVDGGYTCCWFLWFLLLGGHKSRTMISRITSCAA